MNISEIAKLSGVSKSAVSRYFNGGYLSDDKKELIAKVVRETGYAPSAQAQTLRTRKTRQIGVILPKLSSESTSRVCDGISKVLGEQNYLLMLANTANDTQKEIEYLDIFRQHRVEGVIFIATIFTPDHRRILSNMHIPVIIVGQEYDDFDCVYHNDRGAAYALTELMLSKGCKNPGLIGVTPKDRAAGHERSLGFQQALKDHGISLDTRNTVISDFTMQSGYEKASELLSRDNRPDCLFCATDNIAIGALRYCREHSIRVPEDILVTGIGNNTIGKVNTTTLTSANLHYKTSGEEAAKMMLSQLVKRVPGQKHLELGFEIIERESTKKLV